MAKKIRKIKLANGKIYSIFDEGAIRLNENNVLITGNKIVDDVILNGHIAIVEIDDVPVDENITNVLVQDDTTKRIRRRSTDKLLEDIGGISYNKDRLDDGVLALKVGKNNG